ncbi:MAG: EpsI family protein [Burkholderiales bacterium]
MNTLPTPMSLLRATPPRAWVVAIAMCLAAVMALILKPGEQSAPSGPRLDLEAMIPTSFGEWKVDPTIIPVQVSPDVKAKIQQIYDATLSRTYVNRHGDRIMLSIAYGGDQTGRLRVHRPEACYTAQGFDVRLIGKEVLQSVESRVPVTRLMAQIGSRKEPITYWIRVGDKAVTGNLEQRLAQLTYGLTGKVPDGVIFRVSSINPDPRSAYTAQDAFVAELLSNVTPESRVHLVGRVL